MKYERKPFKALFRTYPKTMLNAAFAILFEIGAVAIGCMRGGELAMPFLMLYVGYFCGLMIASHSCELAHTSKWWIKEVDDAISKANIVAEAERIIQDGEEWKK